MKSHLNVMMTFLNHIWKNKNAFDVKTMKATGILLEKLIRYTGRTWALTIAFVKSGADGELQHYIDNWVCGHFLPANDFALAQVEISQLTHRAAVRHSEKVRSTAMGRNTRKRHRAKKRMR